MPAIFFVNVNSANIWPLSIRESVTRLVLLKAPYKYVLLLRNSWSNAETGAPK